MLLSIRDEAIIFDPLLTRSRFPALSRTVAGRDAVYVDGPGGTQVPIDVIDAMSGVMRRGVSNLGGHFEASVEAVSLVASARSAVADLFNANRPGEISFGQNMTSLTFAASQAIARTWRSGDEIVLTRLDHDANVSPWLLEAEARGVHVRFADFDPAAGCGLSVDSVAGLLSDRTRLVAVTHASNALGTIVDVAPIVAAAHDVGALCFVDAVHYTPHGPVDVKALGCDVLVASAYKFFGPHTGVMYGRSELMSELVATRIRPAPASSPGKWETGTQSFESLAGVTAAVDYLAGMGAGADRRESLRSAMTAIQDYERTLSDRFMAGLAEIPGVAMFGMTDSAARTPTFAIDIAGTSPEEAARRLGEEGVFAWHGDYYAVEVMNRLGFDGGLVRIGFVHYNLAEEVDRVLDAVDRIAAGRRTAAG